MLRFVVLVLVVLGVTGTPLHFDSALDSYWAEYKKTYNKQYVALEEATRRVVWEDNLAYIRKHNREADLGKHTYTLGMNEHADLTWDEYSQFLRGLVAKNETKGSLFIAPSNAQYPDMVDWRKQGYVTPVKNQLQCGSCWAFSAVGSLEGQHFKKTGKLVSLSEQNLVDCSKNGNHGCGGGLSSLAFEYIKMNGGIDTEESYPYTAKQGKCHYKRYNIGATCTGYARIQSGSERDLLRAVATVGPISVAIDAGHRSFQLYREGVYYEPMCSSRRLDHGVTAVGYGTEMDRDYWLIKNSWGASWGEDGYIKMSRDRDNNCGIATQAIYPLV